MSDLAKFALVLGAIALLIYFGVQSFEDSVSAELSSIGNTAENIPSQAAAAVSNAASSAEDTVHSGLAGFVDWLQGLFEGGSEKSPEDEE